MLWKIWQRIWHWHWWRWPPPEERRTGIPAPAEASDAAAITALNRLFHLDIPDFRWDTLPWVEEQIRLKNYYVIRDNKGVAAAMCLHFDGETAVVEAIAVRADRQKDGLGKFLLEIAKLICIVRDVKTLAVESFCAYGVDGFYEKCGFVRAAELKQFHGHDYYCFSLDLSVFGKPIPKGD